jgi:pantoate--beta-alanine ligase
MPPLVVTSREALPQSLGDVHPGLVPTMGALHDGHLALIARAAAENPLTVVSIFVNPTQFSDPADLARYPRDLDRDVGKAVAAGAGLIFAPTPEAIYPPGYDTVVEVSDVARRWEGAARPGHFRGVATVVTILLNLVRPRRAYFGEKDYQQLQVIRRMHRDLALPGEIVPCPTVRADDGLALSSRNERLSADARARAAAIPSAIAAAQAAARAGEQRPSRLMEAGLEWLNQAGLRVDYFAIVDRETLEPLEELHTGAHIILAAEIEGVRLIDNAPIDLAIA